MNELDKVCKELDITVGKLAEASGVSFTRIKSIINGRAKAPVSLEEALRLSYGTSYSVDDIFALKPGEFERKLKG